MEEDSSPIFSLSNDYLEHDIDDFDSIIGNFDQCFDDLMFSGAKLVNHVFDCEVGLSLDGNSPVFDRVEDGSEQNCNESNDSLGTTMKPRRDRSKTIVSERRRRGRMKDKLYELRSLVPNITKMDKASIIADSVTYVQSLQNQAKELAEEVSLLESSTKEDRVIRVPFDNTKAKELEKSRRIYGGMVLRVVAHEVGDGKFYVDVECNKGDGVASSLYMAIESLEHFQIESSNLSFTSNRFVLTLTVNVRRFGEVMSASAVRLWVMGSLLKGGFEFDVLGMH